MSLNKKTIDKIESLIDKKQIAEQLKLSIKSDKAIFDEVMNENIDAAKTIDMYVKYCAIKTDELKDNVVVTKKYNNTREERQAALDVLDVALEAESIRNDAMQRTLASARALGKLFPLTVMSDNVIYLQKNFQDSQKRAATKRELNDITEPLFNKLLKNFSESQDLQKMLKGCGVKTFFVGWLTLWLYWILVLAKVVKTFGQKKQEQIIEYFVKELESQIFENYFVPRSNNVGKLLAEKAKLTAKKCGAEYDFETLNIMCDSLTKFLPNEFRDFESIDDMISLFKSGRCDTLKEAYALEDGRAAIRKREEADENSRKQILKSQQRVEELAYQKADEAKKQTEYLKKAADSAEKAANYASEQAQAASRAADSQKKAAEEASKLRDELENIKRDNNL